MKLYFVLTVSLSAAYTGQFRAEAFTTVNRKDHQTPFNVLEHENVISTHNASSLQSKIPKPSHIAFICDGNSRWASSRLIGSIQHDQRNHIGESLGHAKGAARVISTTQDIQKRHQEVKWITIYAFSTENWNRPAWEIDGLWRVMEKYCDEFYSCAKGNVVIKVIGDLDDERIPVVLRQRLRKLEFQTNLALQPNNIVVKRDTDSEGQRGPDCQQYLTLCIAINYGGRKDIVHATRQIAEAVNRGELKIDEINEKRLESFLSTSGIPAPDLIIRTGGDQRMSNFLLWQSAYAELFFTDTLWPDFDEMCLDEAIRWYQTRDRRFGGHS